MAVTINASTSAGLVQTADTSGVLQLQTAGTTAVTVDASQRAAFVAGTAALPAITTTGDTNTGMFFPAADTIAFAEGGAESMRIDSSGNLCVGATSTYGSSRISITSSASPNGYQVANIYNTAASSTTKIANTLMRMSSQGSGADACLNFTDNVAHNYFFGGNNGGAYVMANSGGVRLSNGGTSWASDSDERLKDIIEPIENAIEKVSTLRTVIGKYKTDKEGTRRSFLIAQDVQAVLPEAVVAQDDEIGTLSLAYTETIPLLVAAIKEQQTIINDLKARVTALEGAA
jgi:hypothetical protein